MINVEYLLCINESLSRIRRVSSYQQLTLDNLAAGTDVHRHLRYCVRYTTSHRVH